MKRRKRAKVNGASNLSRLVGISGVRLGGRTSKEGNRRIVREGPRAAGFAIDLWTLRRVAKVIRERFGAAYHVRYLGRLLKKLGFTRQKPTFRATQEREAAIARWRSHDWPRMKKRLEGAARPSRREARRRSSERRAASVDSRRSER